MIFFKNWAIGLKGVYRLVGEIHSTQAKHYYITAEDSRSLMDKYNFLEFLYRNWDKYDVNVRYLFTFDQTRLWCWKRVL